MHFPSVDEAIRSRRSIRRFLPTPVSQALLSAVLELASRAPSGTNAQPWKVYALTGAVKTQLSQAILERFERDENDGSQGIDYYPSEWKDPWLTRRRQLGIALYSKLGITKDDKARMKAQGARNFTFFDAPIGLIFTLDRSLATGMLVDCGIFLANVMIAARAYGLDTCAQGFFMDYHKTIRTVLDIPETEIVYCGMSLGYADVDAPENQLVTARERVEGFTDFRGF